MHRFKGRLEIIGVNPFVFVPSRILASLFKKAGVEKGKIPVHGKVNAVAYQQTLVRFKGEWRLYINTTMLKRSPHRIGEQIDVTIGLDASDRSILPHKKLTHALRENKKANAVFRRLSPSLQQEIIRYIDRLKTEESVDRNVARAIDFLLGKARFVGRALK